jgi:alpha-D-ribose-1-phosphate 5-kinase (ATP)
MLDIISVGNANIDFYPNGKKFPGGSANNFAVACSKLGLNSGFLGFIGNDEYGKFLVDNFKKNKVKTFIKICDKLTGSVEILSKGFDKKFIKTIGANIHLKKIKLTPYFKLTNHIHLATPPIELLKQLTPGLSISVDSGSELSKYSIEKISPFLKNVKIFFANEFEAKKITKKNYKLAAKDFLKNGVKIVIIKRKTVGVYVKTKKKELIVPYFNSKIVDATGGGDAFASAFVTAIIKGKSIKQAAKWGLISSNYKIQKLGAQNTPNLNELINF